MTQPWTTHSEPGAPRKPRRLGLIIPWTIAVVFSIGWSLAWLGLKTETERRLDAAAAALRARGWQASWQSRQVGGYPFRLDVDVTGLKLADPSGWGVSAPLVKSEAYVFAPTRWLLAAPNGLTFTRPDGGPVAMTGRLLRVSINSWDQHPPRISAEGDDVTFAAPPGAKPFALAAAKKVEFYTRPGPDDQGASYLGVTAGQATPGTWLGALAAGGPVNLVASAVVSHVSAFSGPDYRSALAAWVRGAGQLALQQLTLSAGAARFEAQPGNLPVSDAGVALPVPGKLTGVVPSLRLF